MKTNRELSAFFMLSLLAVIYFFPVIFAGKTFYLRDITYIFHPWKTLCAQAVQQGELPLWNGYAFCGMPLLANWQTAVFYPFTLFFYMFDFAPALKIFHFTQVILAGYFAYLCGKREFSAESAALAMMILFPFCGFFITKLEFLSYAGVISWTFALLLFRKNSILLSVSLAFSFLAGHQVFIFQAMILGVFAVFDSAALIHEPRRLRRYSYGIIAALLLSAGLAACQILPTAELISRSFRRIEGIDYAVAMLHSLNLADLPGFISPFVRKPDLQLVSGEYLQWDTTVYAGFSGMVLAAYGIFSGKTSGIRAASLALAAAGLLMAMGDNTPVYPWLYKHFFIFHTMRYPAQYAYFAVTGIVLLAGLGISRAKYGYLLTFLLALDIMFLAVNFRPPAARQDYFSRKPLAAAFLQSARGNGRFILSPGTEKDRYIRADSIESAWQSSRESLFNLTCLPYRVANAYGFGEPLTSHSIETAVQKTYSIAEPAAAAEAYKSLGVSYLLCRNRLVRDDGYTLVDGSSMFIYKIDGNPGPYEFVPADAGISGLTIGMSFNSRALSFNTEKQAKFIWKESLYPGWKYFINGNPAEPSRDNALFPEFHLGRGLSRAYFVYRPPLLTLGLFITLAAVGGLCLNGLILLKRRLP